MTGESVDELFPARTVLLNFTACINLLLLLLSNTRGRSATVEEGSCDI